MSLTRENEAVVGCGGIAFEVRRPNTRLIPGSHGTDLAAMDAAVAGIFAAGERSNRFRRAGEIQAEASESFHGVAA